eukprot:RCo012898
MSENKNKRPSTSPPPAKPRPSDAPKQSPKPTRSAGGGLFFMTGYLLFAAGVYVLFLGNCESFVPKLARAQVCENLNPVLAPVRPFLDISKYWSALLKSRLDIVIKVSAVLFTAPCALFLAIASLRGSTGILKDLGLLHAAVMALTMAHVDQRLFDSLQATASAHNLAGPSDDQVAAIVLSFFTAFPFLVIFSLIKGPSSKQRGWLVGFSCAVTRLALVAWELAAVMAVYEFTIKNVESFKGLPSIADHAAVLWAQSAPAREKVAQAAGQYGAQAYALVEDLGKKVLSAVGQKKAA